MFRYQSALFAPPAEPGERGLENLEVAWLPRLWTGRRPSSIDTERGEGPAAGATLRVFA